MMRQQLLVRLISVLLPVGSAYAMVGGEPDGDQHPQVCAIIGNLLSPEGPIGQRCTVVLVAPDVMITQAHCTDVAPTLPDGRQIWFNERVTCETDALNSTQRIAFTGVPRPGHVRGQSDARRRAGQDNNDIGVLLLHEEITGVTVARIAKVGRVDEILSECAEGAEDDSCGPATIVGYGAVSRGAPGQVASLTWPGRGTRHEVRAPLVKASAPYVTYEMIGCFGDSGGPAFQGSSGTNGGGHVLGTLTSTPDNPPPFCDPANPRESWLTRWDTESVHQFIAQFIDDR